MQNMPGLSKLASLQELRISCKVLEPGILCGCQNLKALRVGASWADSAAVLAAVGGMQGLTNLSLTARPVWYCPTAAAYTALPASSSLRKLRLGNAELPAGAWPRMFASSRAPKLEFFEHALGWDLPQGLSAADVHSLQATADVQHLACCTALQEVVMMLQPGAVPAALQQLQALTALSIGGVADAAAGRIAQLTGLLTLNILNYGFRCSAELTPGGLLQLTALRALTQLGVFVDEDSAAAPVMLEGYMPCLVNQAAAGEPPDVWQQLKKQCEAVLGL